MVIYPSQIAGQKVGHFARRVALIGRKLGIIKRPHHHGANHAGTSTKHQRAGRLAIHEAQAFREQAQIGHKPELVREHIAHQNQAQNDRKKQRQDHHIAVHDLARFVEQIDHTGVAGVELPGDDLTFDVFKQSALIG